MPSFIIPTENRPDLAVGLTRSTLPGVAQFIAPKLFPAFRVAEKGGKISCAQRVVATGTKNREAGSALTSQRVANFDVEYATDTYEGSAYLTDRDIKDHGGIDPAINAAKIAAAYAAVKLYEKDAAALVFSSARYTAATTIDADAPFDAFAGAALAVKHYGEPVLVASETWLRNFVKLPKVVETLRALYGDGWFKYIADLSNVNDAIGQAFGVKRVLIGDDDFWAVAGGSGASAYDYSNAAAVVALRPNEMAAGVVQTVKAVPCYGFAPTFLPESSAGLDEPFSVSTVFRDATRDNAVDVTLDAVPKEINAAAAKLVKLPAANAGG